MKSEGCEQLNSSAQISFAVLGAGNMGRRLAKSLRAFDGVSIKYVYSRNLSQAQNLADICGATALDDPRTIWGDPGVDAVIICLPTFTRLETLKPAIDSGKHIFCEKPLALDHSMADEIQTLLSGYSQTFMVGQVLRFFWEYSKIRGKVVAGEIGDVGTIRLSRRVGYPGKNSWFADPAKSGGVILDLLIHDLDFLRWTCGEVKQIYAKALTFSHLGTQDYALLNMKMESGALGHIEGSWSHPVGSFRQTVEICGSMGMISYDSSTSENLKLISTSETEGKIASRISLPESDPSNDPYANEVGHFLDCIRTGRKPNLRWEDSLQSCRLAFQAIESAQAGKPVLCAPR